MISTAARPETIQFGLDGTRYEIDLSTQNAGRPVGQTPPDGSSGITGCGALRLSRTALVAGNTA
jgi:hypothetical protein